MKQKDISIRVMKHIAVLEQANIRIWMARFLLALSVILIGLCASIISIIRQLSAQQTFEIFQLFSQDPEIIQEFWSDVMVQFWEELPQTLIVLSIFLIVILILIVYFTKKRRLIMRKKVAQLDKYK